MGWIKYTDGLPEEKEEVFIRYKRVDQPMFTKTAGTVTSIMSLAKSVGLVEWFDEAGYDINNQDINIKLKCLESASIVFKGYKEYNTKIFALAQDNYNWVMDNENNPIQPK